MRLPNGERAVVEIAKLRDYCEVIVHSAWIVLRGDDTPRLASCYVVVKTRGKS